MKIRHINSLEEDFEEYTIPIWNELDGWYGFIIIDINKRIWFTRASEFYDDPKDVTEQYIIED